MNSVVFFCVLALTGAYALPAQLPDVEDDFPLASIIDIVKKLGPVLKLLQRRDTIESQDFDFGQSVKETQWGQVVNDVKGIIQDINTIKSNVAPIFGRRDAPEVEMEDVDFSQWTGNVKKVTGALADWSANLGQTPVLG
ncbi:uncharacterized protein LOC106013294 [Aplysia californica]|uniref:Uncharacterized protein LOC106013294 n=1 Tax=Aplysia californica TaxID=6500 RepID=A0ABM1AAM1_APLCA|nr:uncharacterized protein LOC106013294 [Aplysia californica]